MQWRARSQLTNQRAAPLSRSWSNFHVMDREWLAWRLCKALLQTKKELAMLKRDPGDTLAACSVLSLSNAAQVRNCWVGVLVSQSVDCTICEHYLLTPKVVAYTRLSSSRFLFAEKIATLRKVWRKLFAQSVNTGVFFTLVQHTHRCLYRYLFKRYLKVWDLFAVLLTNLLK